MNLRVSEGRTTHKWTGLWSTPYIMGSSCHLDTFPWPCGNRLVLQLYLRPWNEVKQAVWRTASALSNSSLMKSKNNWRQAEKCVFAAAVGSVCVIFVWSRAASSNGEQFPWRSILHRENVIHVSIHFPGVFIWYP